MNVEKAKLSDVPQMHKLINYFAERGEMLPRPLSELYEEIRDYVVVRDGDQLIGCGALHINWSDLAEIKALAVAEERQFQGAGTLLAQALLAEARQMGIPKIFCLTYKPEFFAKFGFREIDMLELPRKIWGECQRCPKYPDCDEVAMVLHLSPIP